MDVCIQPLKTKEFCVEVPASKSILCRALILSALREGETYLVSGKLAGDTRAMVDALSSLGVKIELVPEGLLVHGSKNFAKEAAINVRSSGATARFLTAVLAILGGNYLLDGDMQLRARPMDVAALRRGGADICFLENEGHLPLRIKSEGTSERQITCDCSQSTQFASGAMLAGAVGEGPLEVEVTGEGKNSPYLDMTASLIRAFGGACERTGDRFRILPISQKPHVFTVEPDISAACYFYAAALLCRAKVTVCGVKRESIQGDMRLLSLLEGRGVRVFEREEGLTLDGREVISFEGFSEDVSDFADQMPTLAALALFANSPSRLSGLQRSVFKESDRPHAVLENLRALGADCSLEGDALCIHPAPFIEGTVSSFGDHRIAMAFAVAGLKKGGIVIRGAECADKTFEGFHEIIRKLTLM